MAEQRDDPTNVARDARAHEASLLHARAAGTGEQGSADESAARVHGGVDELALRARGMAYDSIVDFSVNLNPYGPCAPVLEAVRLARLDRYPDALARTARACWAEAMGCQPAQVAVGHGAADLFWAIARAALSPGARVVIAEPTFSEFSFAAAAAGAQVERVFARPEQDLGVNLIELLRAGQGARALYLCSPNNPTGEYVPFARVRELALGLPDTLIVLDQSFIALSDHADDARRALPANVIAVRSLTKEFACPGLRIGLCVGAPHWVRRIEAQRPTWATSSAALAALEVCAREQAFVRTSWQKMRADRDAVRAILVAHGLSPRPSDTSYQLVPLSCEAGVFCERMFEHGVQLRDCSSFGLPRHVRIAALPVAARARLHAALEAVETH